MDGFTSALQSSLGCIQWVQAGCLTYRRQYRGFSRRQLRGGFAEVELGGGLGAVGIVAKVGGVEIPLEDL